ncbi:MAG: hypothetical protein M5U01_24745 [Ardenticatenaceae bacterium]|nr:hypothetical protein [Ardenticatenaceae bacterium]HBY97304.1 lysine biosynthesis protein LysW [Chloroflexota bacterium]
MRTNCPDCEASFELGPKQARAGTLFFCPECGAELEVINEEPLDVDFIRAEYPDEWFDDPEDGGEQ